MLLGSNLEPNWLKRTDWQRTWSELLWCRETCSHLARAPPAGRGAELRLLVQLQTALPITSGKAGKGQRAPAQRVPCKAHNGSKRSLHRTVTAQISNLCPVTVLCSQINSKPAEKNEYQPDCCFACDKFRKLEKGDTKGTIKRFLNHLHIQCFFHWRKSWLPFKRQEFFATFLIYLFKSLAYGTRLKCIQTLGQNLLPTKYKTKISVAFCLFVLHSATTI